MNLKALLFLVLAAVLPLSAPRTAHAAADVSFDYFYDALLPYGEWIEVDGYGFCWRPTDVDADWVPYSDGYWAFTDAGWTFVGYEEFAGIVYHYGRWVFVETEGWCWVPDYEWGPGWVSWRNSDDYVGWAPLPPRATWQPEIGISTWVDTVCDIGPAFYSFCRVRDFGAPVLRPVIIHRSRNVTIIRTTVNITNITYNTYGSSPVIYNGGPSFAFISSRCERPVPTLKLVRQTHFDRADFRRGPGGFSPNARTVGNQLLVNAPIVAPPAQAAFLKDKVKRVFSADKVRDGWAGVKDAKERTELRQRFQRETKGLTPYTAPARAVVASDLKVLPAQADPNAVVPGFPGRGQRGARDRQAPAVTGGPAAPVAPGNAAVVSPGETQPVDPRAAARMERGKDRAKDAETNVPPAVTGGPLKPFKPDAEQPRKDRSVTVSPPAVVAPAAEKIVPPDAPAAVTVPVEPRESRGQRPMNEGVRGGFRQPGEGQPSGAGDAARAKAAGDAEKAAREQANINEQRMTAEKQRAAQAAAEKARADQEALARQRDADANAAMARQKQAAEAAAATDEKGKMQELQQRALQAEREKLQADQERATRQRDADANAAMARQKQAAEAAAATAERGRKMQQQDRAVQVERDKMQADQERVNRQREAEAAAAGQQRQLDAERQAEAAKQAGAKRQQMEAQQQEQIAGQRRQLQMEQQRAAQEAAKQQAADHARAQQIEQQRAAQESAKQQAAEQRRQLQIEQNRAAQDAAKQQAEAQNHRKQMERERAVNEAAQQQAEGQRRALDAQRDQAAREQAEAQRGAQRQAAQAAAQAAAAQAGQAAQAAQQQAAAAAAAAQRGERDKEKDKEKDRDKRR